MDSPLQSQSLEYNSRNKYHIQRGCPGLWSLSQYCRTCCCQRERGVIPSQVKESLWRWVLERGCQYMVISAFLCHQLPSVRIYLLLLFSSGIYSNSKIHLLAIIRHDFLRSRGVQFMDMWRVRA